MTKLFLNCIGVMLLMSISASAAKNYNGAELYSVETVKYGRFDVRMRTISGSGTVSSFFLYYNDSYLGAPEPWEEIDIEVLGKDKNVFQSNIITGNAAKKVTSEELHNHNNLAAEYHTYSVEWTPDYIAWFFDGKEIRRTKPGDKQVSDCQIKEMSYRFNLWISDQPAWVGNFDPSILPVYQFINWMKYSKYTPGAGIDGTDFTPEWQDDFNSFDSKRWGKGDWTFDGNLVDFSAKNIVVKDGYCIICLTTTDKPGFSGQIPLDQETPIKQKQEKSVKKHSMLDRNNSESVMISLDGKKASQKLSSNGKINSGVWINKKNNSDVKKINTSK